MKLNPNYILRRIGQDSLLVSIEDPSQPRRLLFLNPLGQEIYELLQEGLAQTKIEARLAADYEVEADTLRRDVAQFLDKLRSLNVLLPEDT